MGLPALAPALPNLQRSGHRAAVTPVGMTGPRLPAIERDSSVAEAVVRSVSTQIVKALVRPPPVVAGLRLSGSRQRAGRFEPGGSHAAWADLVAASKDEQPPPGRVLRGPSAATEVSRRTRRWWLPSR